MVKRLRNWLKIGLQAGFGPNFTVEFEAEIPKNLGWPTQHLEHEKSPRVVTYLKGLGTYMRTFTET